MTKFVGSPLWIAPEIARGERYGYNSDVYSFGICMSESFNCNEPFKNVENKSVILCCVTSDPEFRPEIDESQYNEDNPVIKAAQDRFVALMKRCWAHDYDDRVVFHEIVEELTAIKKSNRNTKKNQRKNSSKRKE
eukprot:gb/GECH01003418.1/.p1 GENE.gb/GECH01003418.1/~~gb/GECH01003418.1/.p1  ORF type:complete len:135 (+),score=13.98 gb/GECH01003418.1/:1-405(+)